MPNLCTISYSCRSSRPLPEGGVEKKILSFGIDCFLFGLLSCRLEYKCLLKDWLSPIGALFTVGGAKGVTRHHGPWVDGAIMAGRRAGSVGQVPLHLRVLAAAAVGRYETQGGLSADAGIQYLI